MKNNKKFIVFGLNRFLGVVNVIDIEKVRM